VRVNKTPITDIAAISQKDSFLFVSPFDLKMSPTIEKAIRDSALGLNPQKTPDNMLKIPLPVYTKEKKSAMLKQVKKLSDTTRTNIRNIRSAARSDMKKISKQENWSTDVERKSEKEIQKITDQYMDQVEKLIASKEKELNS
jgi:ribosome recycling factor